MKRFNVSVNFIRTLSLDVNAKDKQEAKLIVQDFINCINPNAKSFSNFETQSIRINVNYSKFRKKRRRK